jgi:hypothetical protein
VVVELQADQAVQAGPEDDAEQQGGRRKLLSADAPNPRIELGAKVGRNLRRGEMSVSPRLSRRERYRAETIREIREIAMRQVAEGGVEALSLKAIAEEMGMSGPALYRCVASRDELMGSSTATC